MKCSDCKNWNRLPISDQFLPEDEVGACDGLLDNGIEIELKTGWDGGYIDVIETKHGFFCANFTFNGEIEMKYIITISKCKRVLSISRNDVVKEKLKILLNDNFGYHIFETSQFNCESVINLINDALKKLNDEPITKFTNK